VRYAQIHDGETVYPARRGYRMMCCDCGLVHRVNFRLLPNGRKGGKKIALNVYRDDRATAVARRRQQVKS
jgi:hypothetical protein